MKKPWLGGNLPGYRTFPSILLSGLSSNAGLRVGVTAALSAAVWRALPVMEHCVEGQRVAGPSSASSAGHRGEGQARRVPADPLWAGEEEAEQWSSLSL